MPGWMSRRNAGRLVLLSWAVALTWLARRELGKPEAQVVAEATIRLSPDAHFFSVTAAGHQIGYASITVDTIPGGFALSEVLALDVPEADSIRRFTRRTELGLSRSLRLREFTRTLTGGGVFEELQGTIDGDTVVRFRQRADRDAPATQWSVPLASEVVLAQVLPYRLAFGRRLEVGRAVAANVLDLNTGLVQPVEFRATAESTFVVADSAVEDRAARRWVPVTWDTVRAWRIEHAASGTPVVSWVDARGGLVRSEAALGVQLERSAFEVVALNYRDDLARGAARGHAAVSGMRTLERDPGDPGEPVTITIGATAMGRWLLPRLAWLDGGRQSAIEDDRVSIGEEAHPTGDTTRLEYLGPPPAVSAEILLAARRAAGGARDPRTIALNLARWVADEIGDPHGSDAPSDPERVLASRRGTAAGRARLFAELAQGLELAARPVSGVALLDGGTFAHAWAEVRIDGQWMAVDPTWGRAPASRLLLRVLVGGSGRPIDVVPLIGAATFTLAPSLPAQ